MSKSEAPKRKGKKRKAKKQYICVNKKKVYVDKNVSPKQLLAFMRKAQESAGDEQKQTQNVHIHMDEARKKAKRKRTGVRRDTRSSLLPTPTYYPLPAYPHPNVPQSVIIPDEPSTHRHHVKEEKKAPKPVTPKQKAQYDELLHNIAIMEQREKKLLDDLNANALYSQAGELSDMSNLVTPSQQDTFRRMQASVKPETTRNGDMKELLDRVPARGSEEGKQRDEDMEALFAKHRDANAGDVQGDGRKRSKGLYNDQIDKMMKPFRPYYLGCIASDQLMTLDWDKVKKMQKGGFVMNLDKASQRGSHWVAVYIDLRKNEIDYFDPFGEQPSADFQKRLKKVAEELDDESYLRFKINRIKHQAESADTCGMHCMHWLQKMFRGKSFAKASGFEDRVKDKSGKYEKEIEQLKKTKFNFI